MDNLIKDKIIEANATYRAGNPVLNDQEYDDLLESLKSTMSEEEYDDFVSSLNEGAIEQNIDGKIKHPFLLGSLNKLKSDEPETIKKWIKKNVKTSLSVSAKVDGISSRAEYHNGKLVSLTTRGDGIFGQNVSSKAKYIKGLLQELPKDFTGSIRGELVIMREDFESIKDKYANPRNACAGIMNRKDDDRKFDETELRLISFVPYTILGDEYEKSEQFTILEDMGFNVAWNVLIEQDALEEDIVEWLFNTAQDELPYETDGLVICDSTYRNEDKYRPDKCMAFKINQLTAKTRLIDIEWQGPQKDGAFRPVAILEPVELGGSCISRATLNNMDFIEKKGLKYGSIVEIAKMGDIIPNVIRVISSENSADIEIPQYCSCCGTELVRTKLYPTCPNKDCKDQTTFQTQHFLEKLGIDNVSFKRLQNLKLTTIRDLIKFVPDGNYKIETKLYSDLKEKMFSRSKRDLFLATNFEGISKKILNKIFDFYGFEAALKHENLIGLPVGVGEKTMEKFLTYVDENAKIVNEIISDSRYDFKEKSTEGRLSAATYIGSICFTGSLNSMGRKEASSLAERNGYEVKNSVTKGLTYLVMADPNSTSTKAKKARELGTSVIGEDEFLKMMRNNGMNVDDL